MKREKRLTKREKKAQNPRPVGANGDDVHIHCVACGRHIDVAEFDGPSPGALWLKCLHKSTFPSCAECADLSRERLAEHDRTGQPVRTAGAWH